MIGDCYKRLNAFGITYDYYMQMEGNKTIRKKTVHSCGALQFPIK